MEALLALVLLALCLTPLLALQDSFNRRTAQTLEAAADASLMRSALAVLDDVNPAQTPRGEMALAPDLSVRWTAVARTPFKETLNAESEAGRYEVALYSVRIDIIAARAQTRRFEIDMIGWRPTASADATRSSALHTQFTSG